MTGYERLRQCRLFVLDLDGTLYLGDTLFPCALRFLRTLEQTERQYIYLTNNSSRSGLDYVNRLQAMGLPCTAEHVFSSGMATAIYLKERYPGARICLVGNAALRRELENYGIPVSDEEADVIVVGFDTELSYEKLDRAVHFLRKGLPFLACNPDFVCPMPAGEVLPDCGSICALLTAASGCEPTYIGKPNRRMLDILSRKTGVPIDRICCVGDRLYTDIAVGINAGAVTAAVLSGETTAAEIDASEIKPDYVFADVGELAEILK